MKTPADISDNSDLTPEQFFDLVNYIEDNGVSGDIPRALECAMDAIQEYPDGDTLYFYRGWPVAVYFFDIGFSFIPGALEDVKV